MPEYPFSIEYEPAVLEKIRYAIVDAFYSVPRGGLEIGGILLGRFDGNILRILGHRPLDCEHATGPSFVLSERDHAAMSGLLKGPAAGSGEVLVPVGWYHSHTRSEIFLSTADLEIHRRYFPEPWQVALVLRPASMRPTRAAFFFRQADGTIRSDASYREFVLEPLGLADAGAPAPDVAESAIPAAPSSPEPAGLPVPHFLSSPAPKPKRKVQTWIWMSAAILLLASAGGASVYWANLLPERQIPLVLQVLDMDGQMQIMWNPQAAAIRDARSGTLNIIDGPARNSIPLNAQQLHGGTFNYARQLEIVHLRLTVRTPDGKRTEASTSFLGTPPSRAASSRDVDLQSENEALKQQVQTVTEQLKKEQARGRWMERVIIDLRRKNDALKSHP